MRTTAANIATTNDVHIAERKVTPYVNAMTIDNWKLIEELRRLGNVSCV